MKKFSAFLKGIVASVLAFFMVFALATNNTRANEAIKIKADSSSKVYVNDFYTLSYENNEVKLLLNSDVRVFKGFTKSDLVELKNQVATIGYAAIADDITFEGGSSRNVNARIKRNANNSLSGASIDISAFTQVVNSQIVDRDAVAQLNNGAYNTLIEFYVDRYVDAYVAANPSSDVNDVLTEVSNQLTTAVQNAANSVYEAEGMGAFTPDVSTNINSVVDNVANGSSVSITLGDVSDMLNYVNDANVTLTDVISGIDVHDEIKDIVVNSDSTEVVDFFTTVEMENVIDAFNVVNIKKDEVLDMVDKMGVDNIIDIVGTVGFDKVQDLANSVGVTKNDVTDLITNNRSELTFSSLLRVVKSISINGKAIFADTEIKIDGLKSLLLSLPKPADVAVYEDEQMNISWNVAIDTTFGLVDLDLTVGFRGDCSIIRGIAKQISETIDVSHVDGVYKVTINMPARLDNLVLRLANSTSISDGIKHAVFDNAFLTIDELYQKASNKSLDEYIEMLKKIDYKTILSHLYNADTLNKVLGTEMLTNQQLDKLVDDFGKLVSKAAAYDYEDVKAFIRRYTNRGSSVLDNEYVEAAANKVVALLDKIDAKSFDSKLLREFIDPASHYTNESLYKYIDKIANYENYFDKVMEYIDRAYNAAPDRFKDNSVMDFYKGDGLFNYTGGFTLDYQKVLTKLSDTYGQTIYDVLSVVLDRLPGSINIDLNLQFQDFYKVTYNYEDTTKVGLLPVGADVAFFANVNEVDGKVIGKWVDAEGTAYTTMPNKDVELFAVYNFDVLTSNDIDKVYDTVAETLSVTTTPYIASNTYSYQWYKDGVAIEGATNSTLEVVNVVDSGVYYCDVKVVGTNDVVTSDEINVNITKSQIDISGLTWDYTGPYTYNGEKQKVELSDKLANVSYEYKENVKTDAGSYNASVVVTADDPANYEVVGTVADQPWVIEQQEVNVSTATWNYTEPFLYDGTEKKVKLTNIPDFVTPDYTGNTGTDAKADYVASVTFIPASANYKVVGEVADLTWAINPQEIDVSKLTWDYEDPYTYNGEEQKVELSDVPANVTPNYTGNTGTDAKADYVASVTFTPANANYVVKGTVANLTWAINQQEVNVSTATWNYTEPFLYDGTEKKVELTNIPDFVTPVYAGNTGTDAKADYVASVTFTPASANYVVKGTVANLTWAINPIEIDVSKLTWDYDPEAPLVYNGQEQKVELSDVPAFVTPVYAGNTGTNVDEYIATVTFTPNANYTVIGEVEELTWNIVKRELDVSVATWNYTAPFTYDGNLKTVLVVGYPDGVTPVYANNTGTDIGTYTASVEFDAVDSENNTVIGEVADLTWEIKESSGPVIPPVLTNSFESEFVKVFAEAGIDAKDMLVTTTTRTLDLSAFVGEKQEGVVIVIYDITFVDENNDPQQYQDNFKVSILIPEANRSSTNLKVVHVGTDGTLEDMGAVKEGNFMVFDTTHFSEYAIIEINDKPDIPNNPDTPEDPTAPTEDDSNWLVWLLIALLVIAASVIVVLLVVRRNEDVEVNYVKEEAVVEATASPVIDEVDLVTYDRSYILSVVDDGSDYSVGSVVNEDDKVVISIFKERHQVRNAIGKVHADRIEIYKEPRKVILEPNDIPSEKIIVEHEVVNAQNESETVRVEVGQVTKQIEEVVVNVHKEAKDVE